MKQKLKEKVNKKNNGITLIALVITIIVLLILAGVSISMFTGQNGILTRGTEREKRNTRSTIRRTKKINCNGSCNKLGRSNI